MDKDISKITGKDYTLNPEVPNNEKVFTDEVKMVGTTNWSAMDLRYT